MIVNKPASTINSRKKKNLRRKGAADEKNKIKLTPKKSYGNVTNYLKDSVGREHKYKTRVKIKERTHKQTHKNTK